ncbi:hypothetical protein [Rubinisphaera margarita]|uniref:hypothetical protein n=1 Tax=Rubinisphaera margarita TaxID=2909586 RepID=UPI001EE8A8D2|nr:hypothetical protein [Rubinisphaera margarita]MCG6156718.1 hypothetical protein [Rubinisphaera margarita]
MIRNAFRLTTQSWGLTAGFRVGLIGFLLCWSVMGKSQELKPVDPPDEEGLPILIAPDESQKEPKQKPKPKSTEPQPRKDVKEKDAQEATEADRKKAASEDAPVEDPKPAMPPSRPAEEPAEPKAPALAVPNPMNVEEPEEALEVTPPPMPMPNPLKSVDPGAEAAPSAKDETVDRKEPAQQETTEKTAEQRAEQGEQWTMLITSGPSHVAGTRPQQELVTFDLDRESKAMVGGPHVQPLGHDEAMAEIEKSESDSKRSISPAQYQAVYDSIPFSRAEYLANPSYRHEATMEMLFGELRPTVIHKQDKPQRVYNQPRITEPPIRHPIPFDWYTPAYGYGPASYFGWRYPYWTPNSTYRRYTTQYGPLFNRYYRPLGY